MTVIIRDSFMQRVNGLPESLVTLIGEFLPEKVVFEIKIRELESKVKIKKLLSRCNSSLKTVFLINITTSREFLSLLSLEDAQKEVTPGQPHFIHGTTSGKIAEEKILQIIDVAKASNPKFGYEILNKFRILIKPTKKYSSNIHMGIAYSKTLTMEDVLAVHT